MQAKFHNSVLHFDKVIPFFKSLNIHTIKYLDNMSCLLYIIILYLWKNFLQTLLRCSTQQGYVQNPSYPCTSFVKDIVGGMNRIQR